MSIDERIAKLEYDIASLKDAVSKLSAESTQSEGTMAKFSAAMKDYSTGIRDVLVRCGMPMNIYGYRYTSCAIDLVIKNPDLIDAVTKELYPAVAKKFGSTSSRVERSIRHAIERACDSVGSDEIYRIFGNTISISKGRPTNSEFISMMADYVKREMQYQK